jgi:hypothetical protein
MLRSNERGAAWLGSAWYGTEKTPLSLLLRKRRFYGFIVYFKF